MSETIDWQYLLPYAKKATPEGLRPTSSTITLSQLPESVVEATGKVAGLVPLAQALCNYVLLLKAEKGDFILKIAKGPYRGAQLRHEFTIGSYLAQHTQLSLLSEPKHFVQEGSFYYFLQTAINGSLMSFSIDFDTGIKLARSLRDIHTVGMPHVSYDAVLDYNLSLAEAHLHNQLIDPGEFTNMEDPTEILTWLKHNRPTGHHLALIHGDFRPKNVLWEGSNIVGIVDWAHSTIGDPYYDLAIIQYYLKTRQMKDTLFRSYGIVNLDKARLNYYNVLSKFLNV